jgi:hypothetical protein
MDCTRKHTAYQPADSEWKCPQCGKGPEDNGLCNDSSSDDGEVECPKLHKDDYLKCYACDYDCSGADFARRLVKKNNLVTCPTCKGKGCISKPKNK